MTHTESFFAAAAQVCHDIPFAAIEALAAELDRLRERQGRLFLLGVGGGAGNCSHAVNDFRKLRGIEAYSPIDNVSELTARAAGREGDFDPLPASGDDREHGHLGIVAIRSS